MADHSRAPEQLNFNGDLVNNWKLWKQKFELYLTASGKEKKEDNVKIAILLNLLGDEGIKIYNTFEYGETEDKEKLSVVLAKFNSYCNPTKNLVYEHFKFFKREQLPGETIDQFVTALRQLASTCEFKEKDVLIRDRIVLGVRDARIQEKLLQNANIQLNETIDISRSMEASVLTQKEISKEAVSVDAVKRFGGSSNQWPRSKSGPVPAASQSQKTGNSPGPSFGNYINCNKCGLRHLSNKCPAYNRQCSLCKRTGHYRKFCKNKNNVHEVVEDDCEEVNDSDSDKIVWTITTTGISAIDWLENIKIGNVSVKFKVDTGSQVNTLNTTDLKRLKIAES